MTLKLYIYSGEDNRVDKSSLLTEEVTITGTLRDSCDILNPSIIVETVSGYSILTSNDDEVSVLEDDTESLVIAPGDAIINNTETILKYTYAYIPEFNRYYFITNITSIRQNLWMVSMRVDTLMSFKTELLLLDGFVARNQYDFNKRIEDRQMSFKYERSVSEYVPASGAKVNTTFTSNPGVTGLNIVVTVVSKTFGSSGAFTGTPDASLPTIHTADFSILTDINYATDASGLAKFGRYILTNELDSGQQTKYASYVKSVVAYPFVIGANERAPSQTDIYIADQEIDYSQDYGFYEMLNTGLSKYLVVADFTISSSSGFLDYGEYAKYELYLPYCGWISVNPEDILNKRLLVYYSVSYQDGSSSVYIHDITDNKIIYTGRCQLGVKIGITSDNSRELATQSNANQLSMGITTLSSVLAIAGGVATQNPIAIGGGAIGLLGGVGQFLAKQSSLMQSAVASISTGNSGLYSSQNVKVRISRVVPTQDDTDFAKEKGRPLMHTRTLSNLSGFTIITDIHLDDVPALAPEKDNIKTLLSTGVIF